MDISNKILKKINEYYHYVEYWEKGYYNKWEFDPFIALDNEKKISIFDPSLNRLLYQYGLNAELFIFYTNKFKRDEYTIRFIFTNILEKVTVCNHRIVLTEKPYYDFAEHANFVFFTISNDNCYHQSPLNSSHILCNLTLLPEFLKDRSKFLTFIRLLIEIRQIFIANLNALAQLVIIDRLLNPAIQIPISNLLASILIGEMPIFNTNKGWAAELMINYGNLIGLPFQLKEGMSFDSIIKKDELLHFSNSIFQHLQQLEISNPFLMQREKINVNWEDIFYSFVKDLLIDTQQEYDCKYKAVSKNFINDMKKAHSMKIIEYKRLIESWYYTNDLDIMH